MTANQGDRAGQGELRSRLAECHRAAFAWARHCCWSNRTEAEDVLQETYLKVLDGRARFDGRSSFATWLFGIIRRTAADHRRRHFVYGLVALRWGIEESMREPAPPADAGLERAQSRIQLENALAVLPRRQREVLLLVFFHDFTVEDAARVMAIGTGSARQHYARGKEKLRLLLAALDPAR
jgi:RNA polymerase sigma factor (sigma-70 family)